MRGMYDGWSRAGKVVSLPDEERRKTPDRPFAVQFDRLPDEHWPTPLPRARTFATIERAREVAAETAAGGRACRIVRYGTDLCEDFLPAGEAMRGAASPQP